MEKQVILIVVCMLVATSLAALQRPLANQTLPKLPGNGNGLKNKPLTDQTTLGGKRKMGSDDEGNFVVTNTAKNTSMKLGVRKVEELDMNRRAVCGQMGKFNFDGNAPNPGNPNNQTVERESLTNGETDNKAVDFGSKMRGSRSNSKVKQTGTMVGSGQTNRLKVGNFIVDTESITKTDAGSVTTQVGDSITTVKEGNTKMTFTLSGLQPCGPGGKNCSCGNGTESDSRFLRVYFQAEATSGSQSKTKPTKRTGSNKLRNDPGTNDEEFKINGATGDNSMAILMMKSVAIDDGSTLSTDDNVTVEAATWQENAGTVSGFMIDIPLKDKNNGTKYIYDPTIDQSADESTGSTGSTLSAGIFLLGITSILKIFS